MLQLHNSQELAGTLEISHSWEVKLGEGVLEGERRNMGEEVIGRVRACGKARGVCTR